MPAYLVLVINERSGEVRTLEVDAPCRHDAHAAAATQMFHQERWRSLRTDHHPDDPPTTVIADEREEESA